MIKVINKMLEGGKALILFLGKIQEFEGKVGFHMTKNILTPASWNFRFIDCIKTLPITIAYIRLGFNNKSSNHHVTKLKFSLRTN